MRHLAILAALAWSLIMPLRGETGAVFTHLDLTRPELAAVKEALDNDDPRAAAAALLTHFRTRTSPRWYDPPPPAPEIDPNATDRAAERILRREYTFVGKTATLTQNIDWNANPLRDHEWPIELNRHYTWARLVAAYNRTGNPAYAHDVIDQLRDWCADNPRPSTPRGARFAWRTLECGIRLSDSWPRCFVGMLHSPTFTPDILCLMLNTIWQQADYLTAYHGGGNWLVMETTGLLTSAVLFPEFADAPTWRDLAFARLTREIDQQVPPDGAQVELTPHYHAVTMRSFANAVRIARFNGIDCPANVVAGIERMARYLMDISKPDLHIPMFNDSDHDTVTTALESFADKEHPHIRHVLSRGTDGTAPDYTSLSLPYAGQYIMRSGWDQQALYLALDAGPYGLGHQHEDKLQIDVHAFGRSHILDPGRFTYAGGPWRSYFVSTHAHSTVLVNGHGQNRRGTPRRRWIGREPQDNLWISNAHFDAVAAVYNEGYGSDVRGITHIRKIFFRRGDYWIIHDLIIASPMHADEITADVQYQFGSTGITAAPDGAVILSHNDDANLAILPLSNQPFRVSLHQGEEDPPKGWIAWSLHKALKTPATMAVIRQTATPPLRIDAILVPYRGTTHPDVTVRQLPQDNPLLSALEITGPDWRDVYHWSHTHTTPPGDNAPRNPCIQWTRYTPAGHKQAHADSNTGQARIFTNSAQVTPHVFTTSRTSNSAPAALTVDPGIQSLTVTVPAPGRLTLDYGFAAGGGYLFRREQRSDGGTTTLPLPSIRPGQPYVYALCFQGSDGTRSASSGQVTPQAPLVFDFEDHTTGDWNGAEVTEAGDSRFLHAEATATTEATYLSISHPLEQLSSNVVIIGLEYRTPLAEGGDWCYCKITLTDADGRHWSAYVASAPVAAWRRIDLQREDFRRDDHGAGGNTTLPRGITLNSLAVTLRKGQTQTPVAAVLEIDNVSWRLAP